MAFTTHDNAPYLYRRSGGGGDKEIDKLVGGTIAWNQLFQSGANEVNSNAGTKTYDSTTNTFTVTNSTSVSWLGVYTPRANILSTPNHKYLIFVKATNTLATNLMFGTDTSYKVQSGFTANTEKACSAVISPTNSGSFIFYFNNASSVKFRDIQIFDLTLMFGSTIADYVYSLEQSSQGSGLAWLRSYGFFTEDYYDYNSGELKSVSNLVSHDMTGFNLWDEEWEGGTINTSTGVNSDVGLNTNIRSTNFISALPNTEYYFCRQNFNGNIFEYDNGKNFIRVVPSPTTFTTAANTRFLRFYMGTAYGNTYNHDICINFSSSRNGEYEPYTLHSYPLGDVTLRGLPKLNGNALYYDGDSYESNGTVTRKYGIVTLNGSESWGMNVTSHNGYVSMNSVKRVSDYKLSMVSSYLPVERQARDRSTSEMPSWVSAYYNNSVSVGQNWIYVHIDGITTVDDLKAYLANKPLAVVYELASPTTETADTYTNPQWVDPNGAERYTLSSNAFPMPVGHETT